jgi:rhodanese-related sulfurtransferase
MQQFIDFFIRHWELWAGFFAVLLLLIAFEVRSKITGIPQLSPHQATLLLNRENAVILDLRDKMNFVKGHVINAVNIPFAELDNQFKVIEKYKDQPIIVMLNVGQPISKASTVLQKQGFTKIYNLNGGISAWQNAGLPVIKN